MQIAYLLLNHYNPEHMIRNPTSAHRSIRRLICLLFLAASLWVPLEAAFACLMQTNGTMQCPEDHCTSDCATQAVDDGGCMDVTYLPEPSLDGMPLTKTTALGLADIDNPDLPAILPPREVLPDPPAVTTFAISPTSAVRLDGADTYLLTRRLRL